MIVVALDLEIGTIAGGQGPDLVIVRGGGHVIVTMTGIDHAPGRMIVTMTEGDLVRGLDSHQFMRHLSCPCNYIRWSYHHNFCVQLVHFLNSSVVPAPSFLYYVILFVAK